MARLLLLGSPEVSVDGRSRALTGARRQTLLGLLALHRSTDVPVEYLADRVWAGLALPAALRAVHTELLRLRDLLWGCAAIETGAGGSRLVIAPADLDLDLFEGYVVQAHQARADDPAGAARYADRALDLWRGRPFGDLVDTPELHAEQHRLEEVWRCTRELRIDALLAAGHRPADLIDELMMLTAAWPYRERFWVQLATVLWRADRHADALAAVERVRATLAEDLGVEPSAELRRLEADIRTGDTAEGHG